jgi:hypothetical protein
MLARATVLDSLTVEDIEVSILTNLIITDSKY